jgi:2-methylisocitrate lyase-like PEP mutase family enzyme
MGAWDVLSAKIVERAGFDAVGIQSLQVAIVNGVPDIGIIGPDRLVDLCRRVRRAVSIPIVVDFEQGFGDPYAAVYWMKELEGAGVSAIHIDDYGLPFKCTFFPPYEMGLESVESTAAKIKAMVAARSTSDLMILGRPGTYVATVFQDEAERRRDWLARAQAYLRAGADAIFAICPSVELAKFFRASVDCPLMTIRTLGTETSEQRFQYQPEITQLSIRDIYDLGYEMFIEPTPLLGVSINAMVAAAKRIRQSERSDVVAAEHGSLDHMLREWAESDSVEQIHSNRSVNVRARSDQ